MGFFRRDYNETESRIVNILDGCNKLLDAGKIDIRKVNWGLYNTNLEVLSSVLEDYNSKEGRYITKFTKRVISLKEKKQNVLGYHLIATV